jgi:hypothetical protein
MSDDELQALQAECHREGRWHEERLCWLEADYRRLKVEEFVRQQQHHAEIRMLRGEHPMRRATDHLDEPDTDPQEISTDVEPDTEERRRATDQQDGSDSEEQESK